jgi:ATP-dependent DNA ligase
LARPSSRPIIPPWGSGGDRASSSVPRADGFVAPCIPSRAPKPPAGPDWVHEIKHDGYRLMVRREGDAFRLFTRRGYDWTVRYPAIAASAAKLRAKSFTIDGEAVVCGPDGVALFDALHQRWKATDVMLYAFDLLELDGEDLRPLPLDKRKARLARLFWRMQAGSCSTITRTTTARRCSGRPARWAWRASCRNGSVRLTVRGHRGTG